MPSDMKSSQGAGGAYFKVRWTYFATRKGLQTELRKVEHFGEVRGLFTHVCVCAWAGMGGLGRRGVLVQMLNMQIYLTLINYIFFLFRSATFVIIA